MGSTVWPLHSKKCGHLIFQLFSVFKQTRKLKFPINPTNSGHQKVIEESSHTMPGPVEHCQIKWGQAYVWGVSNLSPKTFTENWDSKHHLLEPSWPI